MTTINVLTTQPPASGALSFAADELLRYLKRMQDDPQLHIAIQPQYRPEEPGIWLGIFQEVALTAQSADPLDDEIYIAVDGGNGLLAGANPRSVLLAVYRYLMELGCRWVRPGADGEIIPQVDLAVRNVHLRERPAYRHRAVCIEGAVSLENVLDMVDWLPKVGLSGYFMQFREGFTFFDRWYRHENNPLKAPEAFNVERARAFTHQIEGQLQKRGLLYHTVGHGWTCEAYGIPCLGWEREIGREWPPEFLANVAEVNGKRAVPWDIVSIAALCYSDPQVQAKLAGCVADYAAANPQIDLLHVWLDDGFNNKCECARCRDHLPADDYIAILNLIDAHLTRRNLAHKIVFLAYVDMLWPPETERIAHPERFVFMFAPISRLYRDVMKDSDALPPLPPFERNHLSFPTGIPGLLSFLRGWQATFQGDSFVYDYHFIGAGLYFNDPGLQNVARVVSEDVKALKDLGLDGMVSCQLQRVFYPTGLGMYVMARTLWDDTLSFEELAEEYFGSAFGADGTRCQAYLKRLAELVDLGWLGGTAGMDVSVVMERCRSALALIRRFLPVIERNLNTPDACHARSWQVLSLHAQITCGLIKMLQGHVQGQESKVLREWQQCKQFVCQHEDELQTVLDVWMFVKVYEKLLADKKATVFG